ncbi:MAG: L,D-transpeptidase family protein [Planctomycetota bacterium]
MLRLGQMPFLTCLVFAVGLGAGFAWKSGWIPVEISAARTGQLDGGDSSSAREKSPDAAPATDSQAMAAAPEEIADDPAIFSQQTEPSVEESTAHEPRSAPRGVAQAEFSSRPSVDRNAPPAADEPEWARPSAVRRPTSSATVPGRPSANTVTSRAAGVVQQTGHREPAASTAETTTTTTSLANELPAIDELIANGETLAAHRALSKLYWNHKEYRAELQSRLDGTARAIFFQPQPQFVEPYVIEPNDQLRVIANKYQLSWEYLARLNKTDPRRIQLGQKLKVVKGPFAAIVDLQDFALTVHLQGYYVRRYDVGIGKDGSSPLGKFTVQNKIENPQYTGPDGKVVSSDDPKNPLGERWIDLGDSYGIHGTIDPDSIGQAASRGCIRLRDKDIVEVYDFLVKGSEVVIRK